MRFKGVSVIAVSIMAVLPVARAVTVTLPAVADTSLYEGNPSGDLGGTTMLAGTNQTFARGRALFRFDTASIPAGAVISEVRVLLYVTRRPDPDQHGGPVDSDFSLYRMLVSWGEGTGSDSTGSGALPGAATWNERHFGAIPWASPGGQIGTDFVDNPSATTLVGNVGPYEWGSSNELVDDVRTWIQNPAANFGYMLASQSESALGSGRRFGSREQPGGLIPPARLEVTYSIVPEPSAAFLFLSGIAVFVLGRRRGRAGAGSIAG